MQKIISIPFHYEEKDYYSLVRVFHDNSDKCELRITIMNGELQRKLEGNHIFPMQDGHLQVDIPSGSREIARLKLEIADSISRYFATHPLSGNVDQPVGH